MGAGKDGKRNEKMEFFNGKDGIDGGIWIGKTDAAELNPAAPEQEKQGNNSGVNLGLAGRLGE